MSMNNMTLNLKAQDARLAAWLWIAAVGVKEPDTIAADMLAGYLATNDPGPLTVEIIPEYEGTDASWIKPADEDVDPDGWLAVLPTDRLALFHLCSTVMDQILAEAVEASPREHDGQWRAACGEYEHLSIPARDTWHLEIQWDDPERRTIKISEFDNEAAATVAWVGVSGTRSILVYGQVVDLSEQRGRIVVRHEHSDPYEGENCVTCGYPAAEHGGRA